MKTKLVVALFAFALPSFAWAQLVMFNATLTGSQETPPTPSPAMGQASATLDLNTLLFDYTMTFSALLAPETDAHLHLAPPGVPGPVVIPLPLGSPSHLTTTLTSAQADQLLAGLWYANVHSSLYPMGEIRGQLMPVPEPSTYAAFGTLLLVGLVTTKRIQARQAAQTSPLRT